MAWCVGGAWIGAESEPERFWRQLCDYIIRGRATVSDAKPQAELLERLQRYILETDPVAWSRMAVTSESCVGHHPGL